MDKSLEIRDRITDVIVVRLGDIENHPGNWKSNPDKQEAALGATLSKMGWAGMPLVYRSERLGGKLAYIDGHLRARKYPDLQVRVLLSDFTDEEADQLLLVYDPLSMLADADMEKVDALRRSNQAMLDQIAARASQEAAKVAGHIGAGAGEDEDIAEIVPAQPGEIASKGYLVVCPACALEFSINKSKKKP